MKGKMMRRRLAVAIVLGLIMLAFAACGVGLVVGSGKSITEERELSGVKGVALSFVGDLRITQGDEEKLVITADDNVMPLITTEVRNSILTIGSKSTTGFQTTTKLQYDLTVRDLNSVRLTGAGNAQMDGLKTDDLALAVSGAGSMSVQNVDASSVEAALTGLGSIEVSGNAARQSVQLSGAGSYDGSKLETGAADVTITGLGSATVWATEVLNAAISGAGNIEYYGAPEVTKKVTGLGSVTRKGDKE